jgi:heme oxygenase
MDQPSKLLLRLNLETRMHHATADERWLRLRRIGVTRQNYVSQLVRIYGFEAPLESAFAYTPSLKMMIDLRARARAGILVQDMLALGLKAGQIAALPQCFAIAPFATPLEALGWMYVNERATLLHDAVRRHVIPRVPDIADGCMYLSAYDGIANARWQELGHMLDRVARTERMVDEVVAAAHAGFRCLIDWNAATSTRSVA